MQRDPLGSLYGDPGESGRGPGWPHGHGDGGGQTTEITDQVELMVMSH